MVLVLRVSDSHLSFLAFELVKNLRKKWSQTTQTLRLSKKKLYQYGTVEDLHYKLLNIMLLTTHNSWFYCFC